MSYLPSYQEKTDNAEITRALVVDGTTTSIDGELGPVADLGGVLTIYYVRPAGSNTNDGLTVGTAFQTLAYALTKLPAAWNNGAFVFDITGITEIMSGFSTKSDIPSRAAPGFFTYPNGLFFGIAFPVVIHSDLVSFLTIPALSIVSVVADPVSLLQTINTAGLTPNALVGKIISQSGSVVGVVRSNTATTIMTTANTLTALSSIDISDPGATLTGLNVDGLSVNTMLEGISFVAPGFGDAIISFFGLKSYLYLTACHVDTITLADSATFGFSVNYCYLDTSTPGNYSYVDGGGFMTNSFMKGTGIESFYPDLVQIRSSAFEDYIGYMFSSDLLNFNAINTTIEECEFVNPTTSALSVLGPGTVKILNTKIDGSVSDPIKVTGQIDLTLSNIPAGAANGGFGANLVDGARCTANSTVNITGASGDVSIGTLGVQTWANVTAAVNNRLNALNTLAAGGPVRGDGTTARRTP